MSVPRVAVRNLEDQGDKDEIRRIFSKFGPLKNVWVADDPPGFAYVFFETFRDAEAAVRHMNGQRVCGMRAHVELTPIEDRRQQKSGYSSYSGRGRGGGYRYSNQGDYRSSSHGRGGPISRPGTYDSREGGRSGGFHDYPIERSSYSRGRGRGSRGGRSNYAGSSYSPSSRGGYGRDRDNANYVPRGRGGFSSSGYDSGYSEPSYGGYRGGGGRGNSRGSYRGREGNYRDQYTSYEYGNDNYRSTTRSSDGGYRGRGRGGPPIRRPAPQSEYEPRGRKEWNRDEHSHSRDYHSDYGYEQPSRSRISDAEYREHRSRPSRDEYSTRDDYQKHTSGKEEYKRHSSSHELKERRPKYRKEEYTGDSSDWEPEYRERSPHRREKYRHPPKHEPSYVEEPTQRYRHRDYKYSPSRSRSPEEGFEPVDKYIAEDEYHARRSRTPSDYMEPAYQPEERRVEYESNTEHEDIERFKDVETKTEELDREVREVEYKEQQEGDRYVKLEDMGEAHYERSRDREPRERERRRRYSEEDRYSPRRGSPPATRRHRTPSPSRKLSRSGSRSTRSKSPVRIRSPIRVD